MLAEITTCTPENLPRIRAGLDAMRGEPQMFFSNAPGGLNLKTFAAGLAWSLIDPEAFAPGTISPRVHGLIRASHTGHGRLELHALEPDLDALLLRDPEGSFFGFGLMDFHREFKRGVWWDGDPETRSSAADRPEIAL